MVITFYVEITAINDALLYFRGKLSKITRFTHTVHKHSIMWPKSLSCFLLYFYLILTLHKFVIPFEL